MAKLTFIVVGDAESTSKKERELQRATARSHAATVAHARFRAGLRATKGSEKDGRRQAQQPPYGQFKFAVAASRKGTTTARPFSRDKKEHLRRKEHEEEEALHAYVRSVATLMSRVERYFAHPLDPFSQIPYSQSPAIIGTLYFCKF